MPADPACAARQGVAAVWQDLALCDNLDIAANIMLGRESKRLMISETRFHAAAASLLAELHIPLKDTTLGVRGLSGGQRQLVAVARAMGRRPRLLALDEPTALLGVKESAQVEELIMGLREQGTTILLACHDIDQMFRLADRIVVLRQGRIVADLRPADTHPDDVVALLSGQQIDSSARHQLTRLHGLTDRLVSADPSLELVADLVRARRGAQQRAAVHSPGQRPDPVLCRVTRLHARRARAVVQAAVRAGRRPGGPGRGGRTHGHRRQRAGARGLAGASGDLAKTVNVASSWSVPVLGPSGLIGVITVFRAEHGAPQLDELDLVTVYAGYAANAIERDRLLDQMTTRNRVLETIREMLETLAGPVLLSEGLVSAVQSLRRGLQAKEVALITQPPGQPIRWRAYAGPMGTDPDSGRGVAQGAGRGRAVQFAPGRRGQAAAQQPQAPGPGGCVHGGRRTHRAAGQLAAGATHQGRDGPDGGRGELAALALEREEAGHAHQQAAALRRSRELQRGFLSRLSHELRTPLTAIRGYASSLLQPDVTWDRDSQQRFLDRIAAESARLGRLVDDLLDFSAIESGIMRLQRDWCDIRLVVEAAIACLPPGSAESVSLSCDPQLPVVWADHDRMEQVFVNLLNNAFGHNPPGTRVHVTASAEPAASEVVVSVQDDGRGMPPELVAAPFEPADCAPATARPTRPATARPTRPATARPTRAATARPPGQQRKREQREQQKQRGQPQERGRRPGPVHREGHRAGSRRPDRAEPGNPGNPGDPSNPGDRAAPGHLLQRVPARRGRGPRRQPAHRAPGDKRSS